MPVAPAVASAIEQAIEVLRELGARVEPVRVHPHAGDGNPHSARVRLGRCTGERIHPAKPLTSAERNMPDRMIGETVENEALISEQFAAFINGDKAIPGAISARAKLLMLDAIGIALASSNARRACYGG